MFKHQPKIIKYSQQSDAGLLSILDILLRNIEFHNEMLIDAGFIIEAERLTNEVHHFDMRYVALTLQTGGVLWTGDKRLSRHLKAMGFERVTDTATLSRLFGID